MKLLAVIIALVAFSTSALAKDLSQNVDELRRVEAILVWVSDNVRDGCLANPNALKVEAELILGRSGIRVAERRLEYDQGGYDLIIDTEGYEGGQGVGWCVARLDVSLTRYVTAPEGHTALIEAYNLGALMSGGTKAQTQEALRAQVSEIVSDLANEILKARGN